MIQIKTNVGFIMFKALFNIYCVLFVVQFVCVHDYSAHSFKRYECKT